MSLVHFDCQSLAYFFKQLYAGYPWFSVQQKPGCWQKSPYNCLGSVGYSNKMMTFIIFLKLELFHYMEINRLSVFLSPLNSRTLFKQQRSFKSRTWKTKFCSSKALKDDMFVKKSVRLHL